MIKRHLRALGRFVAGLGILVGFGGMSVGQEPGPRLTMIFPPGGQAGASFEVQVGGSALDGLHSLICDEPRITATPAGNQRFTLKIAKDVPPGLYDLRARGDRGLSSPRGFFVSPLESTLAIETTAGPQPVKAGVSILGLIETPGDVDLFRFPVKAGQRIVIEGWAERLDSKLRAILELEDSQGRRLASNRGYNGLDPLIDHRAAADGELVLRVFDLTFSGSPEHVYRLDIDTGPRLEFAWPSVLEQGKAARVGIFGRNLAGASKADVADGFDRLEVEIKPPTPATIGLPRIFSRPSRFEVEEFAYDFQGASIPIGIGITDVPVVTDTDASHRPESAQELEWPVEVSGRLEDGDESDWYRIKARRGEVLWFELFGERIGSPVDLDFSIHGPSEKEELLHLTDAAEDLGTSSIPASHADPSGRWVAPADASYRLVVRNVIGGNGRDPRRIYRLSVRREEPDFRLLAIPGGDRDPGVCNIPRGGRAIIDLIALRRRGLSGPIRVTASGLPSGLECPDIWFGPGVERISAIVSAAENCELLSTSLILTGHADLGGIELVREARGATTIPSSSSTPSARLTGGLAVGVVPKTPWTLTATPSRTLVSQGAMVDVALASETANESKAGLVELSAVGAPAERDSRLGSILPGHSKGWYSFQVPERLAPGSYSFAIRGETTLTRPGQKPGDKPLESAAAAVSNPITIEVVDGAFDLHLDSHNPTKIRRGQVIQIRYKAFRRNGFIGKINTELSAPGGVIGLRARGVTFVGRTDAGTLQLVASEDAPLGRQPFLRLEGVGTVEDEPVHHAGCFLDLEITD